MKKVLFLTSIPSPYRVSFFNELGKIFDLTVLFETASSAERDKSWSQYRFDTFHGIVMRGKKVTANTAFCPEVCKYLNRKWNHIIIADVATPTGMLAIQYMKIHRIPYWIEGDGGFAKNGKSIKEHIKRYFISSAKGYFSTGKAHDEYYLTYGASPDEIFRYPFSSVCEADILNTSVEKEEKARLKADLGMSNSPTVISVGQMIPRKGIDLVIRTAAQCKDVDFYIIGDIPSQEYLQLKQKLHAENVQFVDFQKPWELKRYYQAADLFLLLTREDIWGLVVNEAMANGLPVITTKRCGAGLELVKNGVNGYIVPTENVPATVEAIQKVLSEDTIKMGSRSLDIIHNYTIESMVASHARILRGEKR